MLEHDVRPGMRVCIAQTIERREGPWETRVEGVILSVQPKPTGSWFAHGKDDKLWLVRVDLLKDDGERSLLSLDRNTRIEVLDEAGV